MILCLAYLKLRKIPIFNNTCATGTKPKCNVDFRAKKRAMCIFKDRQIVKFGFLEN